MAETLEKTGKTVEDALKAALEEWGVGEGDVSYEVLAQPTRGIFGFGAKPARIRVTKKELPAPEVPEATKVPEAQEIPEPVKEAAPREECGEETPGRESAEESREALSPEGERDDSLPLGRVEKFLTELFAAMKVEVTLQREKTEEGYVFNLVGSKLGILIGKHGQTLDALQYLANLAANRGLAEERIRVILDAEEYRVRREETLKRLAMRLADKAVRIREEVKLEPMNRHERKIIHMTLQEHRRVSTYSDGEEPYRCVVIVPKRGHRERNHTN